jgi:hypothetical protein
MKYSFRQMSVVPALSQEGGADFGRGAGQGAQAAGLVPDSFQPGAIAAMDRADRPTGVGGLKMAGLQRGRCPFRQVSARSAG